MRYNENANHFLMDDCVLMMISLKLKLKLKLVLMCANEDNKNGENVERGRGV
jgi:hypothetical protein